MKMMAENFKLKWNDYNVNLGDAFRDMREEKDFFDVTLACGNDQIQAHKVILSACSPLFRSILKRNPHQHPLLYLGGMRISDLEAIVRFMYEGEVNIAQAELNNFLGVAEELNIKGLAQNCSEDPPSPTPTPRLQPAKRSASERSRHLAKKRARQVPYEEEEEEIPGLPVKSEHRELEEEEEYDLQGREKVVDLPETVTEGRTGPYPGDGFGYETNFAVTTEENGHIDLDNSRTEYNGMLEDAMKTSISKLDQGAYNCLLCDKICRDLTRARQHLEAKHFPSVGYSCTICDKHCKTKHALTCHVSVYHRDVPKVGM